MFLNISEYIIEESQAELVILLIKLELSRDK